MKEMRGKIGLMAASFLMMSFLVPNSVLARIAEDFSDVPLQTVQMITTMPSLIGIVTALLVGKVTPYVYKRYLIIGGTLFYLVGGLFPYFFHQKVGLILLGAGFLGIGLGIMLTCVASLICDCYDEKESSALMGIQAAFISGGGMVFIWLGGLLGKEHWEQSFLAYLLVIVVLVIEIICLPKGKLEIKKSGQETGRIPGNVWFYAILGFLVYVFINVYNSNVSMLVEQRSFGGPVEASYASMCYTFAGMIAGCFTGMIISRIKERVFIMSVLLALAGLLLSFLGGKLWLLCLGGMLCGAAFSTFTPAGNFYAAQSGGEQSRSICIAIFSSVSNFGQAVSPVLVGLLMRPLTIEQRFLGAAAAFVVIALIAVVGIRHFKT